MKIYLSLGNPVSSPEEYVKVTIKSHEKEASASELISASEKLGQLKKSEVFDRIFFVYGAILETFRRPSIRKGQRYR